MTKTASKPVTARKSRTKATTPPEIDSYLEGITRRLVDPEPTKRSTRPQEPEVEISEDLERQIVAVLRKKLSIRVEGGDFTDPNRRTIKVMLGKSCVAEDSFDVVQKPEYDG